jgi:hypothetical protein
MRLPSSLRRAALGATAFACVLLLSGASGARFRPSEAPAGIGSVRGAVTAEGVPLAFAKVSVLRTLLSVQTGRDGAFRFDGVPVGPQVVRIEVPSHAPVDRTVNVRPGGGDSLAIAIENVFGQFIGCPRPTRECTDTPKSQRRRLGRACERHSAETLFADTVRIVYGAADATPALGAATRDSFPNAFTWWPGGPECSCYRTGWIVVAACRECRAAERRFQSAHAAYPGAR